MSRTSPKPLRPLVPLVLIGAAVAVTSACGVNVEFDETVAQEFDLAAFDSVAVEAPFDVTIRRGDIQRVEVEVGERSIDNLIVEVVDGELRLDLDSSFTTSDLVATITTTDLTAVHASGASEVVLPDLDVDDLVLDLEGASHVRTSGVIDHLDLSLSGASSADMVGTEIASVNVDFSGASSAGFDNSVDEIAGSISGASDLSVAGSTNVRVDTSGAAGINRGG